MLTSLSRLAICPWALSWKEDMANKSCGSAGLVGERVFEGNCEILGVCKLFVCEWTAAVMIVGYDAMGKDDDVGRFGVSSVGHH